MSRIEINSINKKSKEVEICFSFDDSLKNFFRSSFVVEYPTSIEIVPDSILVIPFVCSVLPIVWMTDSTLYIPTLDKDFFDCIDDIKIGYKEMYPNVLFNGKIEVGAIEKNTMPFQNKYLSACLFSGGVDATTTVFRHLNEQPLLLTLWGSDIRVGNELGWKTKFELLTKSAQDYNISLLCIKSGFREFDNESQLDAIYSKNLGKGWWYGVKHGIGIISHVAPLAWLYGIKSIYIASSNCPEDGTQVKCASDPRIDNRVRFCGARVFHDGYELNRQKKVQTIVKFRRANPSIPVTLHVCWESDTGENCCRCEKCYRTMTEFWVEGENPKEYGFNYPEDVFSAMYTFIARECDSIAKNTWTYSKERLKNNWSKIEKKEYAKNIKWILNFDFQHLEQNKIRKSKIKQKKMFGFQKKIKNKIKKYFL